LVKKLLSENLIFPSQRYGCRPKNNRESFFQKKTIENHFKFKFSFPETQFSLVNDPRQNPHQKNPKESKKNNKNKEKKIKKKKKKKKKSKKKKYFFFSLK